MLVSDARRIDLASDKEHPTGYFADEVLKPYDKFVAAGVEVVAATPDGATPQIDSYGLKPWFHYPDDDRDFLSQVIRTFAPDLDDIRVTLHHLTELDLIAARRGLQGLVVRGLGGDTPWSPVPIWAPTARREERHFVQGAAADAPAAGNSLPRHP